MSPCWARASPCRLSLRIFRGVVSGTSLFSTPYQITCFDIQDVGKAKRFDVIDLEFRQLETQRAPATVLSELVNKLKDIKGQELRHYGETVRKPLKEASEIISDYLKMMEATNEKSN